MQAFKNESTASKGGLPASPNRPAKERLVYSKIVPKGHRTCSGILGTGHQEMVNCQKISTGRTSRRGLPNKEKAMGQTSMTEKNLSKNRLVMTRHRRKEAMERKNRTIAVIDMTFLKCKCPDI